MTEDKSRTVNADAHIPADTEIFEENAAMFRRRETETKKNKSVTQQVRENKEKLDRNWEHLVKRLMSYAQFYIQNDQEIESDTGQKFRLGPITLLVETYTNMQIAMVQQEVLAEILHGLLGQKMPSDIVRMARVQTKLTERLAEWERGYGVRIEEEGVKLAAQRQVDNRAEGNDHGNSGG